MSPLLASALRLDGGVLVIGVEGAGGGAVPGAVLALGDSGARASDFSTT
jgi:hypothetical protein